MDLHQQLTTIAGPEVSPTTGDADADLDRGRRALRKRRTAQKVGGSVFAVAALVAGITIVTNGTPATTTPNVAQGSAGVVSTRLVAYTGKQPKGYTIDKVPNGWEVQADNPNVLLLAPKNNVDKDPASFVGKIGIMLESKDQAGAPEGTKVTVGDREGVLVKETPVDATTRRLREQAKREALAKGGPSAAPFLADNDAGDGATLWVQQPNGVYLLVQFWSGLGLSQQDMIDLGAGVHVHEGAVQGRG
jgi:hypothetical protein